MRNYERFFKTEIERIARSLEKKIESVYEKKRKELTEKLFSEIKESKAILIEESLENENYGMGPAIGRCFSFSDGSLLEDLLDSLDTEQKEIHDRLRSEVRRINRLVYLGSLEKPAMLAMLAELEMFGDVSDVKG